MSKKVIISFSGIDGSGKSTQIELLKKYLKNNNQSFHKLHLFSPKSSISSNIQDKKLFSLIVKLIKKSKLKWLNKLIRLLNVIIDSWITLISLKINKNVKYIIFDRYYYDILAIIIFDHNISKLLKKILINIIPKPDVTIIFSSSPDVIIKRKKEHSYKNLIRYCKIYNMIAKDLHIKTIDSTNTIEDIESQIIKKIENV